MTITPSFKLLGIASMSALASLAQAHQIWIEQPAGQSAVIRFGEYGENLREASPGLLDKFGKPSATLLSAQGDKSVDAVKAPVGFTLPFKAGKGESIVAEDAVYPLYTFKQGERDVTNWYRPAARLVTSLEPTEPKLVLDVVPGSKAGEFKVFFKGQPLPKAKVSLVTQSGWAKEAHADAEGIVRFDMPWKGLYVAEASHNDKTAGERAGTHGSEKYDGVNYVTSLSYVKAAGSSPIPAGPAAPPNK